MTNEQGEVWVRLLTASLPKGAAREMARRALSSFFNGLLQKDLVPALLNLASEASARQQRMLADLVAPALHPGDAWLALLKEHKRKFCRRAARRCLALWSETLASGALLQGVENALQDGDLSRLLFLQRLTLEVARQRPSVPLRPLERWLDKKSRERQGWRRTPLPWTPAVEAFHRELSAALAPADTPLAASAPPLSSEDLPTPAGPATASSMTLPLPTSSSSRPTRRISFWRRLLRGRMP